MTALGTFPEPAAVTDVQASILLLANLYWPDNPAQREAFRVNWNMHLEGGFVAEMKKGQDPLSDAAELLDRHYTEEFRAAGDIAKLPHMPSIERQAEQARDLTPKWITAGCILQLVRFMDSQHGDEIGHASIGRAMEIIEGRQKVTPSPSLLKTHRPISDAWRTYRPVSHIAAALVTFDWEDGRRRPLEDMVIHHPRAVLAGALAFQEFGISHKPTRGKKEPLLSAGNLLVIPEAYRDDRYSGTRPLSAELLAMARTYTPRDRL